MMFKTLTFNIKQLVKSAHKWQRIDINGKEVKNRFYFSGLQWAFVMTSLIGAFVLSDGFSDTFVGYVIAAFSIFIGLFLTIVISLYTRYLSSPIDRTTPKRDAFAIRNKNLTKQLITLLTYSILIALFSIFLLSFSLLSDLPGVDLSKYYIVMPNRFWSTEVGLFLRNTLIYVYRATVVYFSLDFILMCLFSISAMHQSMIVDINNHK